MITLRVTDNSGALQRAIVVASDTLADWGPFFGAWAELWRDSRERMFETSGRSTDTPWPMYSRSTGEAQYAAIKASIFGRRMTQSDVLTWLIGPERLRPSLTQPTHEFTIHEETPESLTVGTSVPYAAHHDQGVGNAPAHLGGHPIPKRPLLNFGTELEYLTSRLVSEFAARGIASVKDPFEGTTRAGLTTDEVLELVSWR